MGTRMRFESGGILSAFVRAEREDDDIGSIRKLSLRLGWIRRSSGYWWCRVFQHPRASIAVRECSRKCSAVCGQNRASGASV